MVSESIINTSNIYFGLLLVILITCELLYFFIARKLRIGDIVTSRSSHRKYKLTGGGIIFILAVAFYYIWFKRPIDSLLIGSSILALISFIDDIKNISPTPRLFVHFIVVFYSFFYIINWGFIDIFIVVLICGVGFINAYNFMDGINGITAGYSLVTLCSILFYYSGLPSAPTTLILTLIIATLIFAFFNFRKNAVCFAGDVGSIVMGYLILYLLIDLIWATADPTCIIFLIVYGVDTVFTIIQRLFMGENILLPHRRHLYQVFANQWGFEHYTIALGYAMTQMGINVGYFIIPQDYRWTYMIFITIILSSIYFLAKRSTRSRQH